MSEGLESISAVPPGGNSVEAREASPVVLIGESNPYGGAPEFALYCYPAGSSGDRLRRILGLDPTAYLELERVNLCVGAWVTAAAVQKARGIVRGSPGSDRVLVLLGRRVSSAFEQVVGEPLLPFSATSASSVRIVSLPHPSGRNLVWNQAWARVRAQDLLRASCPAVSWGSSREET